MWTSFYGPRSRGHTQASGAFSSSAADWLTFSLQTALNLQPSIVTFLSLPSQRGSVCIYSEVGMDTYEISCIKQHHLFLRLASCREEGATDDAVLVYIFIDSLALIMHCNCSTVTETGFTVFTEDWIMKEKVEQMKLFWMTNILIWL